MADFIDKIDIQARRNEYLKTQTTSYENIGSLVDEKSLNVGYLGTLTTRDDNTSGVITLATNDAASLGGHLCGIGWRDSNGVFRIRMNVTVTVVDANEIQIEDGTGTNLPDAATQIVTALQYDEKITHDSSLGPLLAKADAPNSVVGLLIGSVAAIGANTYTATIVSPLEWGKDLILVSTGFTVLNSSYVGADRAYVANLSIPPIPTKVSVIPFNS